MSIAQGLGDDLAVVDHWEPVTLERRDGGPATPIVRALRRATATREAAPSDGRYVAAEITWHLPAAELAEEPRVGDRIVDAHGAVWTIVAADLQTLGQRWRCQGRNLAILAGLDQRVTIQQASWTTTADGAPLAAWSDWRVNVAACVQRLASGAEYRDARPLTRYEVRVYLADRIELDHNFRIVQGAAVYRVLGCERVAALDQLLTLVVEPMA
ncbi:MAG: hypothetical protein JNG90_12510 [Planctomycetaceae bacterium]|nr:hypothetical protein [Planctomycetaceae bacterium]